MFRGAARLTCLHTRCIYTTSFLHVCVFLCVCVCMCSRKSFLYVHRAYTFPSFQLTYVHGFALFRKMGASEHGQTLDCS